MTSDDNDPFEESLNYHENFKDLSLANPEIRKQRANKLAKRWLSVVSDHVKSEVLRQKKQLFREAIKSGEPMSLLQIKQMDSELKRDYLKEIMGRDEETNRKVNEVYTKSLEEH